MQVIYEDNHLLVVNKPAGLLTQPSGTLQDSLEQQAKNWIKHKYNKPGNVFLEAVHRLDKPVSGIVIFAKTSKALSRLHLFLREQEAKKEYIALVEGIPSKEEGLLEDYLFHDEFQAKVVSKEYPGAKICRLTYRVIEKRQKTTLLSIELETGRYHQIRAQLSHLGCPIVGDKKYGSQLSFGEGEAIALHHSRITIPHPISKELMQFEAAVGQM